MQRVAFQLCAVVLSIATFSAQLSAVSMSVRELLQECHPFEAELTKHLRGRQCLDQQASNFVIRGNQALIFGAGYTPSPMLRSSEVACIRCKCLLKTCGSDCRM
jgi:hypothetical protein